MAENKPGNTFEELFASYEQGDKSVKGLIDRFRELQTVTGATVVEQTKLLKKLDAVSQKLKGQETLKTRAIGWAKEYGAQITAMGMALKTYNIIQERTNLASERLIMDQAVLPATLGATWKAIYEDTKKYTASLQDLTFIAAEWGSNLNNVKEIYKGILAGTRPVIASQQEFRDTMKKVIEDSLYFQEISKSSASDIVSHVTRQVEHYGRGLEDASGQLKTISGMTFLVNKQTKQLGEGVAEGATLWHDDFAKAVLEAATASTKYEFSTIAVSAAMSKAVVIGRKMNMTYDQYLDTAKQIPQLLGNVPEFIQYRVGNAMLAAAADNETWINSLEEVSQSAKDQMKLVVSSVKSGQLSTFAASQALFETLSQTPEGIARVFEQLRKVTGGVQGVTILKQLTGIQDTMQAISIHRLVQAGDVEGAMRSLKAIKKESDAIADTERDKVKLAGATADMWDKVKSRISTLAENPLLTGLVSLSAGGFQLGQALIGGARRRRELASAVKDGVIAGIQATGGGGLGGAADDMLDGGGPGGGGGPIGVGGASSASRRRGSRSVRGINAKRARRARLRKWGGRAGIAAGVIALGAGAYAYRDEIAQALGVSPTEADKVIAQTQAEAGVAPDAAEGGGLGDLAGLGLGVGSSVGLSALMNRQGGGAPASGTPGGIRGLLQRRGAARAAAPAGRMAAGRFGARALASKIPLAGLALGAAMQLPGAASNAYNVVSDDTTSMLNKGALLQYDLSKRTAAVASMGLSELIPDSAWEALGEKVGGAAYGTGAGRAIGGWAAGVGPGMQVGDDPLGRRMSDRARSAVAGGMNPEQYMQEILAAGGRSEQVRTRRLAELKKLQASGSSTEAIENMKRSIQLFATQKEYVQRAIRAYQMATGGQKTPGGGKQLVATPNVDASGKLTLVVPDFYRILEDWRRREEPVAR